MEILRPEVSREANDVPESTGALGHGSGEPGPLDRERRPDICGPSRLGERGEARQRARFRPEAEASGAADRDVDIDVGA